MLFREHRKCRKFWQEMLENSWQVDVYSGRKAMDDSDSFPCYAGHELRKGSKGGSELCGNTRKSRGNYKQQWQPGIYTM
uniref:Uncharacterized protein n=1 Tax=Arundo donax TaxID=35708 RepID=A0A0A9H811_ARUDO